MDNLAVNEIAFLGAFISQFEKRSYSLGPRTRGAGMGALIGAGAGGLGGATLGALGHALLPRDSDIREQIKTELLSNYPQLAETNESELDDYITGMLAEARESGALPPPDRTFLESTGLGALGGGLAGAPLGALVGSGWPSEAASWVGEKLPNPGRG